MKFSLEIECNNDAFEVGNEDAEVARILGRVINCIQQGTESGTLRDVNGATVGSFEFEGER